MSTRRRSRPGRSSWSEPQHYFALSKRPLQILVFLLPLIIAYEISLLLLLQSEHGVLTNAAHRTLLRFFAAFGVAPSSGFYLGGIAVIVVLLLWHLLNRDPWRIDHRTLGLMAFESLLLAIPLLIVGQAIAKLTAYMLAVTPAAVPGPAEVTLAELGFWSKAAISVGAGLYEELMFRMLLIAVIHTLLVDVGNASSRLGAAIAVVVSAAAFTWYHPLTDAAGSPSVQKLLFYFIAGLYFGAVYVLRGFGIVVGTHAMYDIVTVSLMAANT